MANLFQGLDNLALRFARYDGDSEFIDSLVTAQTGDDQSVEALDQLFASIGAGEPEFVSLDG